jgi:hypothetical protein
MKKSGRAYLYLIMVLLVSLILASFIKPLLEGMDDTPSAQSSPSPDQFSPSTFSGYYNTFLRALQNLFGM